MIIWANDRIIPKPESSGDFGDTSLICPDDPEEELWA